MTKATRSLAGMALALGVGLHALPVSAQPVPGCEIGPGGPPADDLSHPLVVAFGGSDFQNPPEVRPTTPQARHTLRVDYTTTTLAGCNVHLRSYNGKLVGETIRASPGDTLYLRVENKLPPAQHEHPQGAHHGGQFSFNVTNLHTHGLHVSPEGTQGAWSDNVFLEIRPDQHEDYAIQIPQDHPTGTFWYHAHFHGSTAIQISSGMAGALIIEGGTGANGGLDTVPVIAANRDGEKIFVLQQFAHGPDGKLEDFSWVDHNRPGWRGVMVNGQFVPTLRMRPGEVQRWRFIHAGVQDNVQLSLQQSDGGGQPVKLHEIAADGLALGRIVPWPATAASPAGDERNLLLGPGYRSDVLVRIDQPGEYVLRDLPLSGRNSIRASMTALFGAARQKPGSIIARVVVGDAAAPAALPTSGELADRVPSALLVPITDGQITADGQPVQKLAFTMGWRDCSHDGSCPTNCSGPGCRLRFMVNDTTNSPGPNPVPLPANDRVYKPNQPPRTLRLNRATEWALIGTGARHPFHIHVNPFQMTRWEPDANGQFVQALVWKDTVLLPEWGQDPIRLRSRHTLHTGKFVLHCHILSHEDQGMMEDVEIVP